MVLLCIYGALFTEFNTEFSLIFTQPLAELADLAGIAGKTSRKNLAIIAV